MSSPSGGPKALTHPREGPPPCPWAPPARRCTCQAEGGSSDHRRERERTVRSLRVSSNAC
eukprot:5121223-Pyramimonas_sp.AAC.2